MNWMDFSAAAPEMTLLGLICVVLLADLFVAPDRRIVTYGLALASLGITLWVLFASAPEGRIELFSGSYVSDGLSQVLKIAATVLVAAAFVYARGNLEANDLHKGEFYLLGLFGLLGMLIMISANSLLTMYLGLETLALAQYALVALDRRNLTSAEAAMKYFVLGAIASGCLLYGISWVYGATGTVEFPAIAEVLQNNPDVNSVPLWFGLAFLIVGIAFKFGGVPFHMWVPDVYQGARTPVTLYIGSAPKLASLALTLRVLVDGLAGLHELWADMLMVIAVLSLVVGNFVAIAQTNIKRMLGYSTIGHVGFILLAVFAGTAEGYAAALFYTLTYVLAAAGAFGMVTAPEPSRLRSRTPGGLQGPECTQPVARHDDDVLHVQHGRRAAVHWLLRQAQRDQCRARRRADRPRGADDAHLRCRRVLLSSRRLVHVFRRSGR